MFADDIYHFAAINYAKFDDVLFLIDNLVFVSIIIVNFRSHNEEVVPYGLCWKLRIGGLPKHMSHDVLVLRGYYW